MIGLDANVLVRDSMQDDPRQSPQATRLVDSLTREQPGFVPLVAVVELVWVLSCTYGLNWQQRVEALDLLLRSEEIVVDRADLVLRAQRLPAKGGAGFADSRSERLAKANGCRATMTPAQRRFESLGTTANRGGQLALPTPGEQSSRSTRSRDAAG